MKGEALMPEENVLPKRIIAKYAMLRGELIAAEKEVAKLIAKRKDADLIDAIAAFEGKLTGFCNRIEELGREAAGYKAFVDKRDAELGEMRTYLTQLSENVKKLSEPPLWYGTIDMIHEDGTITIARQNGELIRTRTAFVEGKDIHELARGQRVLLNEAGIVVGSEEFGRVTGRVGVIDQIIDSECVSVITTADEKFVLKRAGCMREEALRAGDAVRFDPNAEMILAKLASTEQEDLFLEEVPETTYEQIGGLSKQIAQIREEVELPFLYPELFHEYGLELSKGILLYGPPGCGKTLIAKAMARDMINRMAKQQKKEIKGFFLNIKGPEILNKWVGESERKIREIFKMARERASDSSMVTIFIDEAESILRTRGSGTSSDVESTIVPQFLAEIDGLESLKNVIVVLASNRQELIDPAVLRPGRIDRKILVNRPDMEGAREIFEVYLKKGKNLKIHPKYLDKDHPKHDSAMYRRFIEKPDTVLDYIIGQAIKRLWATKGDYSYRASNGSVVDVDNSLIEMTLQSGEKMLLHLRDFVSGAMIENIVRRAKRSIIHRIIERGDSEAGIQTKDICAAIESEMIEAEDLPNIGEHVQQWLEMQGRRERVVHARSLVADRRKELTEQKKVETITTGHYF